MRVVLNSVAISFLLFVLPAARAQSNEDSGKGWLWYEDVIGSASSLGTVTRFDSTLGYNFNRHFAVDFGAPILLVRASPSTTSSTTTTTYRSANGIGDVYTDLRFTFRNPVVNLGLETHIEGGASVKIWRMLNLRGSTYAIEPSGQQKVFSRLLNRQTSGPSGTPGVSHRGVFQNSPETTGSADIARDHGVSIGADASLHAVDLAIGYTHSASYSLDTLYFGIGFNLARFFSSSSY
jgi:hypothetical protein